MTYKPIVSIIIPIFNAERFLNRCLNSISNLEFKNWECLLVDDGSIDRSALISKEFVKSDSRFKLLSKQNGGVSSARNLGLDNALGDWICFIDADDYISSNYLNGVEIENFDVIFFSSMSFQEGVTPYYKNNLGELESNDIVSTKEIIADILHLNLLRVPWGKVIKKKCIDNIRFNREQNIGEDTEFFYKVLSRVKTFKTIPDHVYFWQDYSNIETIKYKLEAEKAVSFFENTFNSYKELGIESIKVERFLLFYFWRLIDKSYSSSIKKWYESKVVQECELNLKECHIQLPKIYHIYKKNESFGFFCMKLKRLFL